MGTRWGTRHQGFFIASSKTNLALYSCPAVIRCGESFSAQRCSRMNKSRCGKMFVAALALGLTFFSVPVASQRKTAALRANDTELLMLGTAGGPPLRKDRSEPATLLIV